MSVLPVVMLERDGEIVRCAEFMIRRFYSVLLECPPAPEAADFVYGKSDA